MNATPIHGWLARRRMGAAEAIEALTEARRAAAKEPAPPKKKADTANPWVKILTAVVAVLVLAGAAVIALVVVGTQVGFYREKMKTPKVDFSPLPLPKLDLTVFTPFATEGVVWMCTLMAVVLVILNRPSGLWTRSMWAFSGIAAFVNAFSAITINKDFLHGVITGGLSIAGPFVVHLFVIWVHHVRSGRTLTEARVETSIRWAAIARAVNGFVLAVLDHTVHPVTALRTISVWRTYRGISYSQAWFIASKRLRARTMQRYNAPVKTTVRAHPETTMPPLETHTPEPALDDRAHGAVLAPERADDEGLRTPCADPVDELLLNLDDPAQFGTLVDAWAASVTGTGARPAASGNDRARTALTQSADTVRPTAIARPVRRARGKKKRGRTPLTKTVHGLTKQQLVIAEFWRRKNAGEPVEGDTVNMTVIARDVVGDENARTTVTRTWKACLAGRHPDPENQS